MILREGATPFDEHRVGKTVIVKVQLIGVFAHSVKMLCK